MASGAGLQERVVQIRRCACVVKGGRRFSFTALVVVGDLAGSVSYGYGKGTEVPMAVEKAVKDASKRLITVARHGDTVPHCVNGKFGSSRVMLMPANPGTGVIAGASVRAVAEVLGVRDLLTKCRGSSNPLNVIKATFNALVAIRSRKDVILLRGR
jgi:small subunit ribosomal protein S5